MPTNEELEPIAKELRITVSSLRNRIHNKGSLEAAIAMGPFISQSRRGRMNSKTSWWREWRSSKRANPRGNNK